MYLPANFNRPQHAETILPGSLSDQVGKQEQALALWMQRLGKVA
jgi:hypothetical protein